MTPNTTPPRLSFFAMPDSPHLTASYCGYTLLTLNGLSTWTTTNEIDRITLNGVDHTFKVLGDRTLMLLPSFKQEAQAVKVYCKGDRPIGSDMNITPDSAPAPAERPPDLSTGLTPASHNTYTKDQ
jgi:hypothetical protein